MTTVQIYGLAAPFILAGLGWMLVWWNAREIDRHRRGGRPLRTSAAE
jgi:hypothetical protein